MKLWTFCAAAILGLTHVLPQARAWDYEMHRLVNELALATLPTNFPSFVLQPTQRERIAFLSGEPDRWRNTPDLALRHVNGPDHYIDIEDLAVYGLDPRQLPALRYDFIAVLAVEREKHPSRWADLTEENNSDHTRQLCGLLPWMIAESYSRLKSDFSYLKAYQSGGGTAEEVSNAQQNVVYTMGVMGHYVGDATQPLHTTKHYNGWVGDNPNGYTTNRGFHAWIDGGFLRSTGLPTIGELEERLRPAQPVASSGHVTPPEQMFRASIQFILDQHQLVERLYRLEKEGSLTAGSETQSRGKDFLGAQLVVGGQMLGDLWFSAWAQAPEDAYLVRKLAERNEQNTRAGMQP